MTTSPTKAALADFLMGRQTHLGSSRASCSEHDRSAWDRYEQAAALLRAGAAKVPVHQFRRKGCADWYDGHADHGDGGDWEERTLYATPPAPDAGVVEPAK